jgi:hypothetical protein
MAGAWTKARRERQAAVMRAVRAKHEAARVEGLRRSPKVAAHGRAMLTAAWGTDKEGMRARLRQAKARPESKARSSAASRRVCDCKRGGVVPAGYEDIYTHLRKMFGAREALRLARELRGVDLRKA